MIELCSLEFYEVMVDLAFGVITHRPIEYGAHNLVFNYNYPSFGYFSRGKRNGISGSPAT